MFLLICLSLFLGLGALCLLFVCFIRPILKNQVNGVDCPKLRPDPHTKQCIKMHNVPVPLERVSWELKSSESNEGGYKFWRFKQFFLLSGGIQQARIPRSYFPKHLQHQAMGNIGSLAALRSKDYRKFIDVAAFICICLLSGIFNINVFVFQENMFSFEVEKERYALKPMNCPGHWYVLGLLVCYNHSVRCFCLKDLHYSGPCWSKEHQIYKDTIS